MGFLSALKHLLAPEAAPLEAEIDKEREALRQAWGLDADDPVLVDPESLQPHHPVGEGLASAYDHNLWRQKLIHTATDAREMARPDFASHVATLMAEHHNLGVAAEEAFEAAIAAFQNAVRQVVADRRVTTEEHGYLDRLRDGLGLPIPAAEDVVRQIVAEAEAVFKARIEGV